MKKKPSRKRIWVLIIIAIGIILCLWVFPSIRTGPEPLDYCKTDSDCETRRINCDGCNSEIKCINKKWNHCTLSAPEGEFCPPPAPPWVTNCKCINHKCVNCRDVSPVPEGIIQCWVDGNIINYTKLITSTTTIPEVVITTDKTEYEEGETIIINVSNNLDYDIFLPTRLTIRRLTDSTWETHYSLSKLIEFRYCCPCPNAPPIFTIYSKSHDIIEWNQTILTYCNESTGSSVIEQTIMGKYKVMIKYSLNPEISIDTFYAGSPDVYTVYSNEFIIK